MIPHQNAPELKKIRHQLTKSLLGTKNHEKVINLLEIISTCETYDTENIAKNEISRCVRVTRECKKYLSCMCLFWI